MRKLAIVILGLTALFAFGAEIAPDQNLEVQVNRSTVVDLKAGFKRVSVANGDIAEAVAVSPTELLLNGKTAGETSLFIWDGQGVRHPYTVHVISDETVLQSIREQLTQEVGPGASLTVEGTSVFLKGVVQTVSEADRALDIAKACPDAKKVVNLLRVAVPTAEPQILLKVRFADIDRSLSAQLGINLYSLDSSKGIATSTTGQQGSNPTISALPGGSATLTDLLNLSYFRSDINLGAVLQDLEAKNILQILAEPDLLTLSGHPASFLAGGQFPFPTIQGGASGVGQITISFKEFGIKLNFLPTITPRGTIHLTVMPEVSSLDYSNGLTVSGYTVPGLATKRVTTDVELRDGQSFAIAGLMNDQLTETMDRMPGIASIPVLGKLFQSRSISKSKSELVVVVTPELVQPLPASEKSPTLPMPKPFLSGDRIPEHLGNPRVETPPPARTSMPVEELKAINDAEAATAQSLAAPSASAQPASAAALGVPALANTPAVSAPAANTGTSK